MIGAREGFTARYRQRVIRSATGEIVGWSEFRRASEVAGYLPSVLCLGFASLAPKPEIELPAIPYEVTPPLPGDREPLAPAVEVLKRRRPFRKSKGGPRDTAKK